MMLSKGSVLLTLATLIITLMPAVFFFKKYYRAKNFIVFYSFYSSFFLLFFGEALVLLLFLHYSMAVLLKYEYVLMLLTFVNVVYMILYIRKIKTEIKFKPVEAAELVSPEIVELNTEESAPPLNKNEQQLNDEEAERIINNLIQFMNDTKAYTKPNYNLTLFSVQLGINPQRISLVLNRKLNLNYNQWINNMRIKELLRLYEEDESIKQYTLEAAGRRVGFSSRSTFINAFKNVTGKTPSAYYKEK